MRALRVVAAMFVATTAWTGVSFVTGLPRACAAGSVHVAVVVDFGSAGGVSSVCVPAEQRESGIALLEARAAMLGTSAPRFTAEGFLCAIDGVPATGCGDDPGAKSYWSYWHGDGSWSYSSQGAGTSRVSASVVEGWRWSNVGADTAPRGSSNANSICTPPKPAPTSPPPTVKRAAIQPSIAPVTMTTTAATRTAATSTTTTTRVRVRPQTTSTTTTTTTTFTERGIAARVPAPPQKSGGGRPVGLIFGVILVAILVIVGLVAARRRARGTV